MVDTYTLNPNLTKTDAVAEWLQQRIDWQIYLPNQRVPSVRKLSKLLDISCFTVVQAYEQLVAINVLTAKPSSGYYVNRKQSLNHQNPHEKTAAKCPVIDTRWLLQVLNNTPHHCSPGSGTLPTGWVRNNKMEWAIRQVTQHADDFIYNYGDIQGYKPLRQQFVQHLNVLGMHTHVDNVMTSSGVSQAVTMVAQLLTQAGDTVLVDSPGWYWLTSCLQQQGLNVIAVERDHQGPNIEHMKKIFATHQPKLYLTNSVLHNPTSYNLHPARAHQVLNLIHKYDAYIFEDDLYAPFVPNGQALRYASLDQFERVFYAAGFLKSMASGWRVGMLVCPEKFIDDVIRIKILSNSNTPEFGERVVHRLWTHGEYRRQIKKVQQQLYTAHERLREALPNIGLVYPEHTQAGIFVWVDTGQDTGELALDAYKEGWLVAPGQLFYPDARASTYLRLNVSTTSDEFLTWLGEYLSNNNIY